MIELIVSIFMPDFAALRAAIRAASSRTDFVVLFAEVRAAALTLFAPLAPFTVFFAARRLDAAARGLLGEILFMATI
jgi:hypothetical protein